MTGSPKNGRGIQYQFTFPYLNLMKMSAMTKSVCVWGGGQPHAWDSQRVRNFTLNLFRKMKKKYCFA